jgi:two-component SAPR family response regulator
LNPYKILVLEEEILVAEDVSISLQDSGYQVERASSLSDALAKASNVKPHLVIIGVVFKSGHNEVEAAVQLESLYSTPLKFIFLVSRPVSVQGRVKNYQLLPKPFRDEDLLKIVNEQFQS